LVPPNAIPNKTTAEERRERPRGDPEPTERAGRSEQEVRGGEPGSAPETVHRPAERDRAAGGRDEVHAVHDADRAVASRHIGGRDAPDDQQDREGHPREPLGTRQQDRVAADHACALVGVDRRQGAQLISIIFSRTA